MNGKIRITKEFTFEMAHALDHHHGKCKNIHGHSYKLSVTLLGEPKQEADSDCGMVMDFKALKHLISNLIVDELDHALLLYEKSPYVTENIRNYTSKLVLVDYQPTCENMLLDFAGRIRQKLPSHISLVSMKLRETETGYAEWHASDQ